MPLKKFYTNKNLVIPLGRIIPISPVWSHPFESIVEFVLSGSLKYPTITAGPLMHISPLGCNLPY
jgi:hypothetical protein